MAKAAQLSTNTDDGGSEHLVGLGELRVVILCESEEEWYAQGLDIDYVAQGTSLEDVKESFELGLEATIEQHLQLYGSIEKLLQPAPQEVWSSVLIEAASGEHFRFSHVSEHKLTTPAVVEVLTASTETSAKLKRRPRTLPFEGIRYLSQCA